MKPVLKGDHTRTAREVAVPPLVITDEQLGRGLETLEGAIGEADRNR